MKRRVGQRAESARRRIERVDWGRVEAQLAEVGYATTPRLLTARECRQLVALYDDLSRFRNRIDMGRHRFGIGEYRYFADPLPPPVAELRAHLYPPLAAIANRWRGALRSRERFPHSFARFRAHCRARGQSRPTPLLLRYEAGGYNCLHQDLYGSVAFPLQATLLLSRPGEDFTGGEFLLVEQRPRMQSRGEAVALRQGEAILFPNAERPVKGKRGVYRVKVRHGISRVHSGVRLALGIIFHDAR